MNLTLRRNGLDYEVQITSPLTSGTVADLVAALAGDDVESAAIDGRVVGLEVPLREAGLRDGSLLEAASASDPPRRGTLVQMTGPEPGKSIPLYSGVVTIGAPPADMAIPGCAGRLRLHVDSGGQLSLRNSERVDVSVDGVEMDAPTLAVAAGAQIRLGDVGLVIVAEGTVSAEGSGTFNRPPRPVVRREVTLLEPPPQPQQPGRPMRFGWAALIVPVVLGVAMAVLIHPRMAIFAIFSPAMLLANWFEDRRRLRKERKEMGEGYRALLNQFATNVEEAHTRDVAYVRDAAVPPADLAVRAQRAGPRLWERRPGHDDFLVVPIGVGCTPWHPEVSGELTAESNAILDQYGELHDTPISVQFEAGAVGGLAGSRTKVLAAARQMLVQAAVHQGPADLAISVFTETPSDWDWVKWLPHTMIDGSGRRRLAGSPDEIGQVVSLLPDDHVDGGPHHLWVVDLPDLSSGNRAAIREALRTGKSSRLSALAIAARPLDLPSLTTTIISLEPQRSRIRFPDGLGAEFAPWQLGAAAARATARALARVDDPEFAAAGLGLPPVVHLESLLHLGMEPVGAIQANWGRPDVGTAAPIGVSADGPLVVDLVGDGPHALLGGTTGAGKSELLRTLVAGLAATTSPTALNFVLVDYKGGSAFDACGLLPHTVGLVTDLDEHLAKRALSCLDAELRYREERLRTAGVSDITAFPRSDTDPLPRLLVAIDEFAALAKELPEFIDALVGIAQRGRSLGVHLLLATQRPSGVISENIKANTNLRIALRMQDVADSVDVIGCSDAAAIGRSQPGRGLARFGPSDVVAFQTALVTGHSMSGQAAGIGVQPFVFAHEQVSAQGGDGERGDTATDLELIVAASRKAAVMMSLPAPRLPWPEELPATVYLDELHGGAHDHGAALFGLADEPHRQRQVATTWSAIEGNLLLYGLSGSGTTTALLTMTVGMAQDSDPDRLHMHILDFDDQMLHPLQGLPHVGVVIGANDRERQLRLLRRLSAEVNDRRQAMAQNATALDEYPTIVTLLDNYGGFADAYGEPSDLAVHNLLARLVADGPGVGMVTVITAKHPGDIPTRIASLVASRLVFRLADRYDYSGLGVPPVEPPTTPGRAFESGSGREIQVALPHHAGLQAGLQSIRWGAPVVAPWTTDVLPSDVTVEDFASVGRIAAEGWFLPVGIGDTALTPSGLLLGEGEHALITGPARSGKSTALVTVAAVAKAADPRLWVVAILPRRSPLGDSPLVDQFLDPGDLDRLGDIDRACLVLVDDAELVGDNACLSDLIKVRCTDTKVVAAGSADAIRAMFGHWTQEIRRSRIGCALRPNVATDGDLWQTPLPRRGPEHFPVGRGYLVADGQVELVQLGFG